MGDAYDVYAWRDMLAALSTASAALIGLFFVGLSVQRERLIQHPGRRFQAGLSVSALSALLVGSILGLTLHLDRHVLGAAALLLAVGLTIIYFTGVRTLVATWPLRYQAIRLTTVAFVLVLMYGLGISLILGQGGGMYWLVAVVVYALPLHMLAAWNVLLGEDAPAGAPVGEPRRARAVHTRDSHRRHS